MKEIQYIFFFSFFFASEVNHDPAAHQDHLLNLYLYNVYVQCVYVNLFFAYISTLSTLIPQAAVASSSTL